MVRSALLVAMMITAGLSFARPSLGEEPGKVTAKVTLGTVAGRTMSPYLTTLSRDGKELAYRTGPDTISIFEPLSGKLLRTVAIKEKEVGERLFYTPDSKQLIFCAMQQFRRVDSTSGKVLQTIGGGDRFDTYLHEFHWNNDCSVLTDVQQNYHFGFKPKVQVWDATKSKIIGEIDITPNGGNRCEAISGDGALIATSGRFHRKENDDEENVTEYTELWDAKSLERKGRIHMGKEAYAVMLGLSADGKYLVVVTENDDGAVIWDIAAEKKVSTLGRFPGGYGTITFSPDDKQFAIQSISGYVVVYETATGKKVAERQCAGQVPTGVGFRSQGEIVACYGERTQVRVSVVNREKQPATVNPVGHTQPVVVTHFSPDGKTILTVGHDDKVLRWDVATGKLLDTMIDESGQFSRQWGGATTFSPDGKYLVVSFGGWLTLYDVEKKQKVADLQTQDKRWNTRFGRVDFTEDMKKVIARGEGQENRDDFEIVIIDYAAAWNIGDGSPISEFSDRKRDNGETAFAKNYADEKLLASPTPKNAPQVDVGSAIRDPWASSFNAGALNVGNQLTLRDAASKEVYFDKVLNINNGLGISFSPDGKQMAVPMNDNTVKIFELP